MSTELLVFLLIVVLAVVLIAGGLFLSRRGARGDAAPPAGRRAAGPPPGAAAGAGDRRARGRGAGAEAPVEPEVERRAPRSAERPRLRDRLGQDPRRVLRRARPGRGKIDPETWDELEETLLLADVGMPTTQRILEDVKARAAEEKASDSDAVLGAAQGRAGRAARAAATARCTLTPGEPNVWMFVGVNGVGKTTTIAKLAQREVDDGHSRRARRRRHVPRRGRRPARALGRARRRGPRPRPGGRRPRLGRVRRDERGRTAAAPTSCSSTPPGRLHTKVNLMEELKKLRRIVDRTPGALKEVLLVVDATTGQNGLAQARQFAEAVDVTGVVLTKLDGTAKGGIVLAIQAELGLPVKVVGIGEGADDLIVFDPAEFVDALFD